MLETAQRFIGLTESSSEIAFKTLPTDDPWHRQPDASLAHDALCWTPVTTLDEGLCLTAR